MCPLRSLHTRATSSAYSLPSWWRGGEGTPVAAVDDGDEPGEDAVSLMLVSSLLLLLLLVLLVLLLVELLDLLSSLFAVLLLPD